MHYRIVFMFYFQIYMAVKMQSGSWWHRKRKKPAAVFSQAFRCNVQHGGLRELQGGQEVAYLVVSHSAVGRQWSHNHSLPLHVHTQTPPASFHKGHFSRGLGGGSAQMSTSLSHRRLMWRAQRYAFCSIYRFVVCVHFLCITQTQYLWPNPKQHK